MGLGPDVGGPAFLFFLQKLRPRQSAYRVCLVCNSFMVSPIWLPLSDLPYKESQYNHRTFVHPLTSLPYIGLTSALRILTSKKKGTPSWIVVLLNTGIGIIRDRHHQPLDWCISRSIILFPSGIHSHRCFSHWSEETGHIWHARDSPAVATEVVMF